MPYLTSKGFVPRSGDSIPRAHRALTHDMAPQEARLPPRRVSVARRHHRDTHGRPPTTPPPPLDSSSGPGSADARGCDVISDAAPGPGLELPHHVFFLHFSLPPSDPQSGDRSLLLPPPKPYQEQPGHPRHAVNTALTTHAGGLHSGSGLHYTSSRNTSTPTLGLGAHTALALPGTSLIHPHDHCPCALCAEAEGEAASSSSRSALPISTRKHGSADRQAGSTAATLHSSESAGNTVPTQLLQNSCSTAATPDFSASGQPRHSTSVSRTAQISLRGAPQPRQLPLPPCFQDAPPAHHWGAAAGAALASLQSSLAILPQRLPGLTSLPALRGVPGLCPHGALPSFRREDMRGRFPLLPQVSLPLELPRFELVLPQPLPRFLPLLRGGGKREGHEGQQNRRQRAFPLPRLSLPLHSSPGVPEWTADLYLPLPSLEPVLQPAGYRQPRECSKGGGPQASWLGTEGHGEVRQPAANLVGSLLRPLQRLLPSLPHAGCGHPNGSPTVHHHAKHLAESGALTATEGTAQRPSSLSSLALPALNPASQTSAAPPSPTPPSAPTSTPPAPPSSPPPDAPPSGPHDTPGSGPEGTSGHGEGGLPETGPSGIPGTGGSGGAPGGIPGMGGSVGTPGGPPTEDEQQELLSATASLIVEIASRGPAFMGSVSALMDPHHESMVGWKQPRWRALRGRHRYTRVTSHAEDGGTHSRGSKERTSEGEGEERGRSRGGAEERGEKGEVEKGKGGVQQQGGRAVEAPMDIRTWWGLFLGGVARRGLRPVCAALRGSPLARRLPK